MTHLRELFRTAVSVHMDTRGKPATLGKIDGTLYYSSTRRDMVWARIGESASNQEAVVRCTTVTPQLDMPVRVDNINGVLSVVSVDDKRYLEFSGNRPGGSVGAHAWLHGRLGPDPLYMTGLQFLPLLVVPTNPADLTVTVKQGAFRWDGTYKIFEEAASGSLSSYVPASSAVKHFVIICLDRANNTLAIVDGADLSTSTDALFGSITVTPSDVTAISIADAYLPLAAVLLYNGQTEITVADIVMGLRTWGGEDYFGATSVVPEPDNDGVTYGRKTSGGVSSWVAVVPAAGGQFSGNVGINVSPSYALDVNGALRTAVSGRGLLYNADAFGSYLTVHLTATGNLAAMDIIGSQIDVQIGDPAGSSGTSLLNMIYSSGNKIGFFNATPVSQQSAVRATTALENLGLGASLVDYVPDTGGTFTGQVTIARSAAAEFLVWNQTGSLGNQNCWQQSGTNRWSVGMGTSASGGNFTIGRFNDAGASQGNPIYIQRSSGYVRIGGGGVPSGAHMIDGGVIFNEAGASVDHRFEGVGNANLLFLDGSADSVGINTGSPSSALHVVGVSTFQNSSSSTSSNAAFRPYNPDTTDNNFASIAFRTDTTGAGATTRTLGIMECQFVTHNDATRQGDLVFGTSQGAGIVERMRIGAGVQVGSPTGGDKGVGTINATAVYDDNVLLTDYIFDLYYDGKIAAEDRALHPTARLWSLEETAVFTKSNRHLPAMPGRDEWKAKGKQSLGQLITSLWETVEQQQLHIFDLDRKLKAITNG